MADPSSPAVPAELPWLIDAGAGLTLRAPDEGDLAGMVEQSRDPESIRWTTVPTPPGGYSLDDAREFLAVMRTARREGTSLSWALQAERDGRDRFCGLLDLRLAGSGSASVGYALHPGARGRSLMSAALRLVVAYGFDRLGLEVITWKAHVGNWASRRAAAAAGFRHEGVGRLALHERGRRLDAWRASITAADDRGSRLWARQPVLTGGGLRLRPLTDRDLPRVIEACNDAEQRRWLDRLPQPYGPAEAWAFRQHTLEGEAAGTEYTWAVTEPQTSGDDLVGCLSALADPRLPVTEIGYWVHPAHRGRGVAPRATTVADAWIAGRERTALVRCHRDNTASLSAAARAGFTRRTPLGPYLLLTRD